MNPEASERSPRPADSADESRKGDAPRKLAPGPTEMLRQFVADRDEPCPACRYNLRNLQTHCCPECGLPLVLRVALAEPAWGTYLASLVGCSIGAGFCGLLLVYAAFAFWFSGFGPPLIDFVPLLAGTVVCGSALVWLLRRRRKFVGLRRSTRTTLAGWAWVCGIGFPLWFMIVIR